MDYKNNKELSAYALGIAIKHGMHREWTPERVKFQWASRRMTNCFGTANYQTLVVKVSPVVCELNGFAYGDIELEELIVHELVHLILYAKHGKCMGHGREFQARMKKAFPNGTNQGTKSFTCHKHKTTKRKPLGVAGFFHWRCGCVPMPARAKSTKRAPCEAVEGEFTLLPRHSCTMCGERLMFYKFAKADKPTTYGGFFRARDKAYEECTE